MISCELSIILSACAELLTTIQSVAPTLPLTEAEVVQGLKEALKTGASNSSGRLATENGYFGDEIKAKYSTDYDGESLPETATWTDLEPTLYTGDNFWTWTSSGELSIPIHQSVDVALIYYGSTSNGRTWEIDNIQISEAGQ